MGSKVPSRAVAPYCFFVARILTNDLLYDLVLFPAGPCTLVRLSHTCRAAHSAVHSHISRTFNINAHLARYFPDPLAFRSLQAATGTLVSGSNALQFLGRTLYPEADLDLFCFYEERAAVGHWLVQQGYSFRRSPPQALSFDAALNVSINERNSTFDAEDEYCDGMKCLCTVYTFVKPVDNPEGPSTELKVQIIVTTHSPMDAVLHFHSTVVLNVISYSHAYALYPRATFKDRTALCLLRAADADLGSIKEKYERRGWRFLSYHPTPPRPHNEHDADCAQRCAEHRGLLRAFPPGLRWIGDKHSWVVPLDLAGVQLPAHLGDSPATPLPPRDPSFVTSWEMVAGGRHWNARGMETETDMVLTTTGYAGDRFWWRYAIAHRDRKLRKAIKRAERLQTALGHRPPSSEQYCDGELIRYCQMVLEERKRWEEWYPDIGAHRALYCD